MKMRVNRESSPEGHLTSHDRRCIREFVRRTDAGTAARGVTRSGRTRLVWTTETSVCLIKRERGSQWWGFLHVDLA